MRKINLGCLLHLISGQGLATKIGRSGWRSVESRNLTGGVVALHRAIRPA